MIENAAIQAGMPVGPLAVLDETALSLSVHLLDQSRADRRADGKTCEATPGELLVKRIVREFARSSRASGGGFYDCPAGGRKSLGPELKPLFEKADVGGDIRDLKDRLLYRQAVETSRCLNEGARNSVLMPISPPSSASGFRPGPAARCSSLTASAWTRSSDAAMSWRQGSALASR